MKKYLIVLFMFIFIGCENKVANSQAQKLFKNASIVVKNNPDNTDSLNYAIALMDSAINYDKRNLHYYLSESHILLKLKQYNKVIEACNNVLSIDKENYFALLTKGVAFDRLYKLDSSQKMYRNALLSLEGTKFATEIFKDYQRIIMYGLLVDNSNFDMKMNEFQRKYSKSSDFAAYYDELRNFKKSDYLNSY